MLILAAVQDIRSGRISNRLIAAGIMMGMIFQVIEHQAWGVYYFLGNISVPVILLYLLFQMRVLGAGDIKLFSMIGSMLTIQELFQCIVYSFVAAGAGSVLFLAADKTRWKKLRYAVRYLFDVIHTGKITTYVPFDTSQQFSFAFSVPVLFGTALVLFM